MFLHEGQCLLGSGALAHDAQRRVRPQWPQLKRRRSGKLQVAKRRDRHRLELIVWHPAATHMGLPDAWLEKNVMTCPAGSWTVKTSW